MLILSWIWQTFPPRLRSKGCQIWPYGHLSVCRTASQQPGYLLQPGQSDAIDVFDMVLIEVTPSDFEAIS